MPGKEYGLTTNSLICAAIHFLTLWINNLSGQSFTGVDPVREYCQWETFNASCPADQVILMHSARYGRMRFGRCMKEDHGSEGCSAVVLPHLDRKCSGRRICELGIPDPAMHNIHPCPKELMPYLEASYLCVPVKSGSTQSCALNGGVPVNSQGGGYLASLTAIEVEVGSKNCPWIIEAQPGQKINLTLYSFSVFLEPGTPLRGNSGLPQSPPDSLLGRPGLVQDELFFDRCDWTIIVQDGNSTSQISGCGGAAREKLIYTSSGGSLKVYIQPSHNFDVIKSPHILIRYRVFGCPDLVGVRDAVLERRGDTTIITCISSVGKHLLSCMSDHWKGDFTNCSKAEARGPGKYTEDGSLFPYGTGLLLIIGIGVVMGVTVGILMLFAIVIYLRRRRDKNFHQSQTADTLLQKSEYNGSSSHSIYSQQHRRRVDYTDYTSTLCPYHHHLKYHMISPSSEITTPGGFEEEAGSLPVSASVVSSPTTASFPLLAFTSFGNPGSVHRSASMQDRKGRRAGGRHPAHLRGADGDLGAETTAFMYPCQEAGERNFGNYSEELFTEFPPGYITSNGVNPQRTCKSTDELSYQKLPIAQSNVVDLIRHSKEGLNEIETPKSCSKRQRQVNIV